MSMARNCKNQNDIAHSSGQMATVSCFHQNCKLPKYEELHLICGTFHRAYCQIKNTYSALTSIPNSCTGHCFGHAKDNCRIPRLSSEKAASLNYYCAHTFLDQIISCPFPAMPESGVWEGQMRCQHPSGLMGKIPEACMCKAFLPSQSMARLQDI